MRMKGHRGHLGHHGHHGPHHGHHGHHGPHHGPHHHGLHRGPHHGPHHGPHDDHHGPHHEKHLKLNPHQCKPKHKILKRLHKRDHGHHHAWKLHCGHSKSPIAQQVNGCNPGMTKHFGRHCKRAFSHFRKCCCEHEPAHARLIPHHDHRGHVEGLQRPQHHHRSSSVPPTISLDTTDLQQ